MVGKCNQPVGLRMFLRQAHHSSTSGSLLAPSLQHTGHQIGSNSKPVLRRALHTFFSTLTEPAAPVNPEVFPMGLRSTSQLWQSSDYVSSGEILRPRSDSVRQRERILENSLPTFHYILGVPSLSILPIPFPIPSQFHL